MPGNGRTPPGEPVTEDMNMKENSWKKCMAAGVCLVLAFAVWTVLVMKVDVQPAGVNGTDIGFAGINTRFHQLTGEHEKLYRITDWLGLVPIAVCIGFGALGLVQLIRRKSLLKVDPDIILLGIFYIVVILAYLIFEKITINYRPTLFDGQESSYPSSTTLLVLSVMPTVVFQACRRIKNMNVRRIVVVLAVLFAAFMVIGRLVSGVHWLTDILGSVFLSAGLYLMYRAAVMKTDLKK